MERYTTGRNVAPEIRGIPGFNFRRIQLRQQLAMLLSSGGNTVAWYQPGVGVTGTLNASAWANQLGAAGSLVQASGANQPIVLPFTGEKYYYGPGVASNYLSTPNAAANQITGDIDLRAYVAANDWALASAQIAIAKWEGSGTVSGYYLGLGAITAGRIVVGVHPDGGAAVAKQSTVVTGFSNGTAHWIRATVDVDNGAGGWDASFYTSEDGIAWTQLGSTVTTATAITFAASDSFVQISGFNIANGHLSGKTYRAQIYNGINGTLAVDFNAADWSETSTNGATQVSSTTGETWTLHNTEIATPAAIVGSPFIVTNAVAHWMRATYTAAQPRTLYIVGMDPVWAAGQYIADGVTANTLGLSKTTSTPRISLNAGAAAAENAGFTLRAKHILTIGLNGASSFTTVDGGTPVTGDPGAGDPGGLTIGADGGTPTAGSYGGFWYSEIIDRNGTDSAATQARIQALLKQIHGTP